MTSVKVSHIEVVQSIQNANNDSYVESSCEESVTTGGVPLIAGKATYVRVYFENLTTATRLRAKGELKVELGDGTGQQPGPVPSEGAVTRYAGASPSLIEQRLDWSLSLNFKLDDGIIAEKGDKTFSLDLLEDTTGKESFTVDPASASPKVEFREAKRLACRALIFRYRDVENDVYLEPTSEEVDTICRYVERSFPVAEVEWSTVRVEAQREFYALDPATHHEREHDETATRMLAKLLHQIMAHRNQELKDGFPTDTYYIGVYSDPRGRFGSVAVDAPPFALPHVVAACATDSTGEDGAHEIAHLLGRSHPGVPLLEVHGRAIGQYRIDGFALTHMGKSGFLSPPDKAGQEDQYIGLDIDASNHSPTVLAPTRNFDLMSYRSPRWPSVYTYRELYKRLVCTDAGDFDCKQDRHWTVICSFDINRKDGQILSVLPTNYRTPKELGDTVYLEQRIVKRAVDQLNSQLDWLIVNDLKNLKFWKSFLGFIPAFPPIVPAPVSEPKQKCSPEYTVSEYNKFVRDFIDYQVNKGKMPLADVLALLNSNDIATELYAPDIRIFPNYADDPGETSCPEENIDDMWDNAISVYYRRVGSKDRFPFGLLQATVTGKEKADQSSKITRVPPTSLTLMIDRVVVDKYAQPFEDEEDAGAVSKAITDLTDCIFNGGSGCMLPVGLGGDCEDRPASNSLVYDIRKDSYYLNFHWPMAVLRQVPIDLDAATITTTIQCKRPGTGDCSDEKSEQWETVCVTNELRGQVWISPYLFTVPSAPDWPPRRPSAKQRPRSIESREQDALVFRFLITVGFYEYQSKEYTAQPELVIPRRHHRFKHGRSEAQCPDDFQYDDGTAALFEH